MATEFIPIVLTREMAERVSGHALLNSLMGDQVATDVANEVTKAIMQFDLEAEKST